MPAQQNAMPLPDDIREFEPGHVYREGDETTLYWIHEGQVHYRHEPIRGAHLPTFRFYLGHFAKDRKNCYCTSTRLKGGSGATFETLNYCYARDERFVYTMGGKVKDADPESFVVCDDGSLLLVRYRAGYGFGKDKNRVYYYDSVGKTKWVRKATPESFESLNDGYFGKDDHFVFCGSSQLAKAKVELWHKIGGLYSRDDRRIYYLNREIAEVDYDSFDFVPSGKNYVQLAKDKNTYFRNDQVVSAEKFAELLGEGRQFNI